MLVICFTIYLWVIGVDDLVSMIVLGVMVVIIVSNMFLSALDPIDAYDVELGAYSYVEDNARTFIGFGLVIAAFILALNRPVDGNTDQSFKSSLVLITVCFILVLQILWMPNDDGKAIRILRDVKTCIFTLGSVAVIIFFYKFLIKEKKADEEKDESVVINLDVAPNSSVVLQTGRQLTIGGMTGHRSSSRVSPSDFAG
jgi:hypothetical protein